MTRTFENSGSEKEFLDIYQREEMDKYVKPSVTVDSVIFRYYEGRVQTLLIKRKNHPFMGKYAFSGGFVQEQEDLNLAVCREVQEEHPLHSILIILSNSLLWEHLIGILECGPLQWLTSAS